MTPAELVQRLLDPTPLSEDELTLQVAWGRANGEGLHTLINYHHPLMVGLYLEGMPEHFGPRHVIGKKHQQMHTRTPDFGLWLFERAYRPLALHLMLRGGWYRDDPRRIADLIISVWIDTEEASSETWKDVLRAFPLELMPAGDTDLLDPSGTTTVYRGIAVDTVYDEDRESYSWTTSPENAAWFARRFATEDTIPLMLTGTVDNDKVLFCTNDRNESEVVSAAVQVTSAMDLDLYEEEMSA